MLFGIRMIWLLNFVFWGIVVQLFLNDTYSPWFEKVLRICLSYTIFVLEVMKGWDRSNFSFSGLIKSNWREFTIEVTKNKNIVMGNMLGVMKYSTNNYELRIDPNLLWTAWKFYLSNEFGTCSRNIYIWRQAICILTIHKTHQSKCSNTKNVQ